MSIMKAFEKLLELSPYTVCKTAAEHFCGIIKTNEVFTTVIRVFDTYKVLYVESTTNIVKYIESVVSKIVYQKSDTYQVLYKEDQVALSVFIESGNIKVTYICKQ